MKVVSLRVYYRNSLRVALFSGKFWADSPRNEVQRWFLVIYKSWQIEAAGFAVGALHAQSRGCCDFLVQVHPVDGNYPSGNQHSPAWEKQSHFQARFGWGYVRSQEGIYM